MKYDTFILYKLRVWMLKAFFSHSLRPTLVLHVSESQETCESTICSYLLGLTTDYSLFSWPHRHAFSSL